jgi:hypothetical protein
MPLSRVEWSFKHRMGIAGIEIEQADSIKQRYEDLLPIRRQRIRADLLWKLPIAYSGINTASGMQARPEHVYPA